MADVFISYVNEDRSVAERLAQALTVSGYSVWWDRDLHVGAHFAAEIERQLDAARAVIVLWSQRSRDSQWVRDEAAVARDAGKLVPVQVDGSPVPLGFRQLQSIDLSAWDGTSDAPLFVRIRDSLSHFVTREAASAPAQLILQPGVRGRTKWTVVAIVLVLLAVGAGVVWRSETLTFLADDTIIEHYTVTVSEFITEEDDATRLASRALDDLVGALNRIHQPVRVAGGPGTPQPLDYRIEGTVQSGLSAPHLVLRLLSPDTGRVLWTDGFELLVGETTFERADLAALTIQAVVIAQQWGRQLPTRSEPARLETTAALTNLFLASFSRRGDVTVAARNAENALRFDPDLLDAHWLLAIIYGGRVGLTLRADDAAPQALATRRG